MDDLNQAIARTRLVSDAREYVLVRLRTEQLFAACRWMEQVQGAFSGLLVDPHEITLIAPEDAHPERELAPVQAISPPYCLITFDVELDFDLVGYMAGIAQALATAGIPLLAISAFSRDHILVPTQHIERAQSVLQAWIQAAPPNAGSTTQAQGLP